jgi:hypothetical protein
MKTNKKEWSMSKLSSENLNMMSSFAMMKHLHTVGSGFLSGLSFP